MKNLSKIILVIGLIFVFTSCSSLVLNRETVYKPVNDSIDVALIYPKTGANLGYGEQFLKAATLAQQVVNDNGGINGKNLQLITLNSENSPNKAKSIAENLINKSTVLCVIADTNNNCAESAAPIYEKAHMTQITPMASSDEFIVSGKYQFSASSTRSFNTKLDVQKIISDMGYKSVGVIYINSSWAGPALETFERTAEVSNLQIRVKEPIADGQTKFKSIIKRIRQTKPDCLYILADYDETIKLAQAIRIDQWDIPIIVTGSYVTEQPENVIGTSLGSIISRRLSSLDIVIEDRENFIYEYRNVADYSDIEFGMQVYDTVMMVAKAAEKSYASLTRNNFRDALLNINNFNGLLGDVSFDNSGVALRPFYIAKHVHRRWENIISWNDIQEWIKFE